MFYTTSQYNGMSGSSNSKYARSSVTLAGFSRLTKTLIAIGMIILATTSSTSAAYLIDYEGDVLPTEAGWTRAANLPDPLIYSESVSNGIFTIDATATGVATVYYDNHIASIQKDFVVEWRARTSNEDGASFVSFYLYPSGFNTGWDSANVNMTFHDGVEAAYYQNIPISMDYHVYRLESNGSLFSFSIDGIVVGSGVVADPQGKSADVRFGFVKNSHHIPTLGEWDYVRVWEVPEPTCVSMMAVLFAMQLLKRRGCLRSSR